MNLNGLNTEFRGHKLELPNVQNLIGNSNICFFAETMNSEQVNLYVDGYGGSELWGDEGEEKRSSFWWFCSSDLKWSLQVH